MAKKKRKATKKTKPAGKKTAKRGAARPSRTRAAGVRIAGEYLEISGVRVRLPDPRTAALCGAACTCDGVGCGLIHPAPGLHCQANPQCPSGCKGTCIYGANHAWILPDHACSHGHTF